MTIGEKITHLRTAAGISQEQLAEKIDVSRQSVSKWEMDQSVPQLDKILALCEIFNISADNLLKNEITIHRNAPSITPQIVSGNSGNKYFGTDGFRGEVNTVLTADHAFRIGRFLGWYFRSHLSGCQKPDYRPKIVIGKDTRRSSYMLEYSIVAGITASGADAYMLHVTTTPSVSYVTRQDEFDCGIMITASHNPFYDNGIKIINRYGEKFDDSTTALIETYMDGNTSALGIEDTDIPLAKREKVGRIIDYVAGRNRYVGYLISVASHSYKTKRIGLDSSNGSSWMIAKAVFDALGAQTYIIGAEPNGININSGVGSTHIETLKEFVINNHLDAGFAFDGDADRCIAVDENGNVVDGDKIIYILALRLLSKGALDNNTVVTTIMSNSGLTRALAECGIKNEQTNVGDRFVYEKMLQGGFRLGGEQSGHIILKKYATTGDGILTAIMIMEEIMDKKKTLSKLCEAVQLFPQKTKNVKVTSKEAVITDPHVVAKFDEVNKEIGSEGRALLRQSGTEPVVRIMLECATEELCDLYIKKIYSVIKDRGYCCE